MLDGHPVAGIVRWSRLLVVDVPGGVLSQTVHESTDCLLNVRQPIPILKRGVDVAPKIIRQLCAGFSYDEDPLLPLSADEVARLEHYVISRHSLLRSATSAYLIVLSENKDAGSTPEPRLLYLVQDASARLEVALPIEH